MARGKHRKRKARRQRNKTTRKLVMWLLFAMALIAGTGTIAMAMRGIEVNVKMEP